MRSTRVVFVATATSLALVAGTLVIAGPLSPAAGPVASTYKTLTEVEPRIAINLANTPGDADSTFKITQPGSYYLTGTVNGESGKHGIEVAAAGVTLDLNGFAMIGVAGSKTGVFFAGDASSRSTVRNGTVRLWGGDGAGYIPGAYYLRVHNIIASGNTGMGINVGSYSEVRDCIASGNGGAGIRIYAVGRAEGCTAHQNGGNGIEAGNTGNLIVRCIAIDNTVSGFDTKGSNKLIDCTANGNESSGFSLVASEATNCEGNGNGASGFFLTSATATGCTASFNTFSGFAGYDGAVMENNIARSNGSSVASRAGFSIYGAGGKLAGNFAHGNPIGFSVSGANIFAVNNTAIGSTNVAFSIGAGNDTGAVLSNPGVGFSTTNPAANYAP